MKEIILSFFLRVYNNDDFISSDNNDEYNFYKNSVVIYM